MPLERTCVPTAPGRLPILGHSVALARKPTAFLSALGDHGRIVRVYLGPTAYYVVTDPDAVHEVLVTKAASFVKGKLVDTLRELLGGGLLTASGAERRKQRRIMQPAFHRSAIPAYVDTMCLLATRVAESWQDGERLALNDLMMDLTLEITAKVLFATELAEDTVAEIQRSIPVAMHGMFLRSVLPKSLWHLPIPSARRFDAALARIRTATNAAVAAYQENEIANGDLMSLLVGARYEDGSPMNRDQLRDEAVGIVLAGTETSAAALSMAFYEFARNPHVERRVADELAEVIGGGPITADRIKELDYTNRVIREVLRMYGAPMLMRRACEPVVVAEHLIHPGEEVIYSPYVVHHNRRFHPDPSTFDPDRWLGLAADAPAARAFIPFGGGNTGCLGQTFALTEIAVAIAAIVPRFRLDLLPGYRMELVPRAMFHPRTLPMVARAKG